MELGSLLLGAALLLLVAAYLARPFFEPQDYRHGDPDAQLSGLLAERDRVLDLIADLDMDRAMRKLEEDEYRAQRAALVKRGAEILRGIDERRQRSGPGDDPGALEQVLEDEIARRRQGAASSKDEIDCPSCGKRLQPGAGVCGHCGAAIERRSDA